MNSFSQTELNQENHITIASKFTLQTVHYSNSKRKFDAAESRKQRAMSVHGGGPGTCPHTHKTLQMAQQNLQGMFQAKQILYFVFIFHFCEEPLYFLNAFPII